MRQKLFINAICLALAFPAGAAVADVKFRPDTLFAVDSNRATVIDGVVATWGAEVEKSGAGLTSADLRKMLEGLRADKLLAAIESSQGDAAVGSRALERTLVGTHQPWLREYAGRAFNLLVRLFTGLSIRDTQCGLKLFSRVSTRRAFELQRGTGFGFDPEVLFLIERLGGKVVEVAVRWNDNPATKVRLLRDSAAMALDLVRLRWRAWTGQYSGLGTGS